MMSSLRQRATRLATQTAGADDRADPQWIDPAQAPDSRPDGIGAEAPSRRSAKPARPAETARRLLRWPMWLDFRRFGLTVSIGAAMVASAIGGGLVAVRQAVTVPASPVVARATAPDPVPPAAPVAKSAAADGIAHGPSATAAAVPAESASAAASRPAESPPVAPAAATVIAETAAPASMPAPAPADVTFGLDINGDGIPDSLERFVRKTIAAPATRVAARRYYRLALPLAAAAQQGEALAPVDQKAVFRAAECYLLSAADDGLADPPNLNDRASLVGAAAARRMQALAEALQGFDYRISDGKRQSCA